MTSAEPKPLVLIVDDSEDNRTMYAEFLSFSGFRVVESVDGADAIEKATRLLPDVIVTDLVLPITDGWEATRRLKDSAATRHIPIVALSGSSSESGRDQLSAAGFDAFFMKPCPPDALVNKLYELIGRKPV